MTNREALRLLWQALPANDGWFAWELGEFDGKRLEMASAVTDWTRFRRWSEFHGWSSDVTVAARPYLDRTGRRLYADSGAVWVRVESNAQFRALEAFDVEPTVVLREGGTVKHLAVWAVSRALDPDDGIKVNRHMAHKLRAPKRYAEQCWVVPPGAVMRAGRVRGVPIVAAGGSGDLYSVGRICATLPRNLPDPEAWRKAAA